MLFKPGGDILITTIRVLPSSSWASSAAGLEHNNRSLACRTGVCCACEQTPLERQAWRRLLTEGASLALSFLLLTVWPTASQPAERAAHSLARLATSWNTCFHSQTSLKSLRSNWPQSRQASHLSPNGQPVSKKEAPSIKRRSEAANPA